MCYTHNKQPVVIAVQWRRWLVMVLVSMVDRKIIKPRQREEKPERKIKTEIPNGNRQERRQREMSNPGCCKVDGGRGGRNEELRRKQVWCCWSVKTVGFPVLGLFFSFLTWTLSRCWLAFLLLSRTERLQPQAPSEW